MPMVICFSHGQTLANRMKPGPSLQVEKWLCLCYLLMFRQAKQPSLKLRTRTKQLLGSLPLDIALPASAPMHFKLVQIFQKLSSATQSQAP